MRLVSLICHRDVELGIKCLGSLIRHCRDGEGLFLLDDGSLTEEDVQRLHAGLPDAQILLRRERDPLVEKRLKQFPKCWEYRNQQPLGLKLFDASTLFEDVYLFVDADILFCRPFSLASIRRASGTGFVFMEDEKEGYSGRSLDFVYRHKLRLFSRINSGIIAFAPHLFDLDFVEWFLGVPEFRVFPHLLEQTCWAALSRNHPTSFPMKRQIRCATKDTRLDEETVALHFIFPYKGQVDRFLSASSETVGVEPANLKLVSAARLTLGRMVANGLQNRLAGLKGRW